MNSLVSTCIKPPCSDDYCVDLRNAQGVLLGCFNSSNTICAYSLPSLQQIHAFPTNSSSVLSEICSSDSNQVYWSDRSGIIGSLDLRSGISSPQITSNEEIFSIDSAGYNLASSSDKKLTIYDIRNYKQIQSYTDLYADENDILCVRIHKTNTNWVLSCCEDSLMALCDINNIEEDSYNLINVDEPALKIGFINDNVFCVTLNSIQAYDVKFNEPDAPYENLHKYKIFEFQSRNPEISYFIDEFWGNDQTILAGNHGGQLFIYNSENPLLYFTGHAHSATIRCSVEIQGIFITGGEDSAIYAWSLNEVNQSESSLATSSPAQKRLKNEREDRYFRPY